eukprot:14834002-Heterocapsa_arctica.AAC.1
MPASSEGASLPCASCDELSEDVPQAWASGWNSGYEGDSSNDELSAREPAAAAPDAHGMMR